MAVKRVVRSGSFKAQDTSGDTRTIYIFVDMIDAGTMSDPHAEIPGMKHLKTSDGFSVNRLSKGKYEIVQTGEILSSDDPAAP